MTGRARNTRLDRTFTEDEVNDRLWSTSAAASLASALTQLQTFAPPPPLLKFRRSFMWSDGS